MTVPEELGCNPERLPASLFGGVAHNLRSLGICASKKHLTRDPQNGENGFGVIANDSGE